MDGYNILRENKFTKNMKWVNHQKYLFETKTKQILNTLRENKFTKNIESVKHQKY